MNSYLGGTEVRIAVDLSGYEEPISVEFRVLNHKGEEILEKTPISIEDGQDSFEVIVSQELNELEPANQREIRLIEVYIQTAGGTVKTEESYIIESEATLVTAVNSFQTYPEALMTALTITDIDGWNESDKNSKVTAMIAAWRSFSALRFRYFFDQQDHILDENIRVRDITLLTPEEFNNLPSEFREALKRAQILQANESLRSDDYADIEKLASLGVTRTEVYEAKISLGTGKKPIRSVLCNRAMAELSKWLYVRRRLTRVR